MTKRKNEKKKKIIYKTIHRKLKIEQHESYKNTRGWTLVFL